MTSRAGRLGVAGAVVALGIAVTGLSWNVLAKDRFSANCPSSSSSKLGDDTYKGEYEARVTAVGELIQRIELRVHGTFTMERQGGSVKSVTGKEYFSLKTFTTNFLSPSAEANAEGDLEWGGATSEDDRFDLGGELKGAGSIGAADKRIDLGGGAARDVLSFTVIGAGCDYADGKLTSVALGQAKDRLRGLGQYQVSEVSGYWSATTETRAGDAQKKLKEDLDGVMGGQAPSGVVRTRGTMANAAARIALSLFTKYEHMPLIDCLLEQYRDYVSRYFKTWVEDDTAALKELRAGLSAPGPAGGAPNPGAALQQFHQLEQLLGRATEADRTLALFGVDSCYASVHTALWTELNASLDAMLTWLVTSEAPPQDLFRVLRQAELLGEISPPLRARVFAAVASSSERMFKQLHDGFKQMRASTKATCAAPVLIAYRMVYAAAKQCQLVQGACEFPSDAELTWKVGCNPAGPPSKPGGP